MDSGGSNYLEMQRRSLLDVRRQLSVELSQREVSPATNRACPCSISSAGVKCSRSSKKMEPLHELLLAPFDKFIFFGIVPFKLFLHVALCILIILDTSQLSLYDSPYTRATAMLMCNKLMPAGFGGCTHGSDIFPDNLNGYVMFTRSDFVDAVRTGLENLYNKNSDDALYFQLTQPNITTMTYEYYTHYPRKVLTEGHDASTVSFPTDTTTEEFTVTPQNFGPFDARHLTADDVRFNIIRSRMVSTQGHFQTYHTNPTGAECVVWQYKVRYRFAQQGIIRMRLDTTPQKLCSGSNPLTRSADLTALIITVCAILLVLCARSIAHRFRIMKQLSGSRKPFLDSCYKRITAIPTDLALMLVACTGQIILQIRSLADGLLLSPPDVVQRTSYAVSAIMIFYCVKRYMHTSSSSGALLVFSVLDRSATKVLMFLISCIPLVMGFVVGSVTMFSWSTLLFSDFGQALSTLFCISNGDSMVNIFEGVFWAAGYAGHMFLYCWCCLAIFLVVNVFLVIVQDTYEDIIHITNPEHFKAVHARGSSRGHRGQPGATDTAAAGGKEMGEAHHHQEHHTEPGSLPAPIGRAVSSRSLRRAPGRLRSDTTLDGTMARTMMLNADFLETFDLAPESAGAGVRSTTAMS